MSLEIERKFIVQKCVDFENLSTKKYEISQGYLSSDPDMTIRLRIKNEKAFLTIKTRNEGPIRKEWEYELPVDDAREIFNNTKIPLLTKVRYEIPYENHIWEIDVFKGELEGLILAEIELSCVNETFSVPDFIGEEVTDDARYYNSNLIKTSFPPNHV